MNPSPLSPLQAVGRVLGSVDALRNGAALYLLLAGFSGAGLFLAMARQAAAKGGAGQEVLHLMVALAVAFYGANAAGLVLMDQARGRPCRSVGEALRAALLPALQLLLVLGVVAAAALALAALAAALLAGARVPGIGPVLFGLAVPLGTVLVGGGLLVLGLVIGPLAAPAVWSGAGIGAALGFLAGLLRRRLPEAVLLALVLGALTAAVGGVVAAVIAAGSRAVLLLAAVVGVELPVDQWVAGLFGYGLRSLQAAGQPVVQDPRGAAALVGGGLVFALALVLPGLVYLRGTCAVFLALREPQD